MTKPAKRGVKNECYTCTHRRTVPGDERIKCVEPDPDMTGNPYAIEPGWFCYPLLFDPLWKTKLCANYDDAAERRRVELIRDKKRLRELGPSEAELGKPNC